MSSVVTLAQLKAKVLDRADMTNSDFIDDTQLTDYINAAAGELYDQLVLAFEDHFYTTADISVATGEETYDLPSDFYKCLKVYWVVSGAAGANRVRRELKKFTLNEKGYGDLYYWASVALVDNRLLRYRIMGEKLVVNPLPNSGGTIEMWYVPEMELLVDDTDEMKFSVPVSWPEWIVVSAAIRCLTKEESDTSALEHQLARITERILNASHDKDIGAPDRVVDVYNIRLTGTWGF